MSRKRIFIWKNQRFLHNVNVMWPGKDITNWGAAGLHAYRAHEK